MDPRNNDEITNDMNSVKVQQRLKLSPMVVAVAPPTSVSVDGCDSHGITGRERISYLRNQCFKRHYRRHDKVIRAMLLIVAACCTICISSARSTIIVVESFSFKPFRRSRGSRHESSRDTPTQVLSATSKNNENNSLPSLVDWKVDSDGKRITGRSVNHPFVPDGELITTALLDPSCLDGVVKDGDVVTTIQGTRYELLKPPPVGSSYFATPSSSASDNKNQNFKEDIFSYTTTGLPYDQQLAFLEELTDMVKTMQAAEAGTTAEVSRPSPSTTVTNPSGTSASIAAKSGTAPLPLAQETNNDVSSTADPIDSGIQRQQLQTMQLNTQLEPETTPELPQRPTFSINKTQQNQEPNKIKDKPPSTSSNGSDDNNNSLLEDVANVAVAATAAAAVTLGGQTGIANEFLDEAKRQVESQIPPPTKELLTSVNTQVEKTSKVVLPYLEEQIRIAEAKVEEARLEEKAKLAWNEVADYINEQSRAAATKKALATSTTISEATTTTDSVAAEAVTSSSNEIIASTRPTIDNEAKLLEKQLDQVEDKNIVDAAEAEQTKGLTSTEKQLSAQVSTDVEAESSATNDVVKEPTSMRETVEEVASTTPIEGATAAAKIEEVVGDVVVSSDSPQSFEGEQTSRESEQIKVTEEVDAENLRAQVVEKTEAESVQPTEKARAEAVQVQVQDVEKAEPQALEMQAATKVDNEVVRVEAVEKSEVEAVEAEAQSVALQAGDKADVEAAEMNELEMLEAEAETLRQAAAKAEAKATALRAQAAEKVEAEAEVLRVKAISEEQELTEANRIVAEQLEVARREVEQAAIDSSETQVAAEVPLVTETSVPKVEVVKASEPITKSAPSVVETFGGNFVVAQEATKLRSAGVSATAPSDTTEGVSEKSFEKPTSEMVENAITVEVEPVDTSLISKEDKVEASDNFVEGEAKGAPAELSETLVSGGSVLASTEIKASETVQNSEDFIGKVTGVIEKGKKTTRAIGDAGREVIDTGKRTVQSIKTTGQEMIDTGKRTYETVVDTGREVVDTGKRTAKAIEETGQKVGAKGKELYETGQKYAGIVNEKIPIIIESGEKAAAAGKEILQDEQKVKAILAGSALAGAAVTYATGSFPTEQVATRKGSADDIQSDTVGTRKGNYTFAGVLNNSENSNNEMPIDPRVSMQQNLGTSSSTLPSPAPSKEASQEIIVPEMLSSEPSPKAVAPLGVGAKRNGIIDTTSTNKPDSSQDNSKNTSFPTPKSFPSQASQKKNGFATGPVSTSKSFSDNATAKSSTFATPKPFPSKAAGVNKKGFAIPSPKSASPVKKGFAIPSPKSASPVKKGFAIPSPKSASPVKKGFAIPSPKSAGPGKQSPFGSSPKQAVAGNKIGSIPPPADSNGFKKQPAPFGSLPKKAAPSKQPGFGVPPLKSSTFGKKASTSPFGNPPNQAANDKLLEKGVSSSKSNPFDKERASPFGSSPKQSPSDKQVGYGAPAPKSAGPGKQSPFASSPKQGVADNKIGSKTPPSESNGFKKQESSSFGSSPKKPPSDKVGFGVASENSSNSGKQAASPFGSFPKSGGPKKQPAPFGSLPKKAAPGKQPGFGVPPSPSKGISSNKLSESPFKSPPKKATKKVPFPSKSPFQSEGTKKFGISSSSLNSVKKTEKTAPQSAQDDKTQDPLTTQNEEKISIPAKEANGSLDSKTNQTAIPKFGIPSRTSELQNVKAKKESPANKETNFPMSPKMPMPEKSEDDGNEPMKDAIPSEKNSSLKPKFGVPPPKFKEGQEKRNFEGQPSFKMPNKAGVGGKNTFADMRKKSPFPTKKAPFPPKKSSFPPKAVPTSNFGDLSKKAGVEAGKSASPFAERNTKKMDPPKAVSTPNFNTEGKPETKFDGAPGAKTIPKKTGVEAERKTSTFAEFKSKSAFPPKDEKVTKPNFGTASTKMLSNKARDKPSERSYFTDTSRNGYNEQGSASFVSATNGDDNNGDNLNDKEIKQNGMSPSPDEPVQSSRSLTEDDEELRQESTYLTDENQKRFFPQSPSTQAAELGYRVGASTEENRDQRKGSTYLTEENQGAFRQKSASSKPQSEESKPRITSIDETALNGNDGDYGKSPDELMAEVMRIAREQEERKNR